jgi:hypothetical protein
MQSIQRGETAVGQRWVVAVVVDDETLTAATNRTTIPLMKRVQLSGCANADAFPRPYSLLACAR